MRTPVHDPRYHYCNNTALLPTTHPRTRAPDVAKRDEEERMALKAALEEKHAKAEEFANLTIVQKAARAAQVCVCACACACACACTLGVCMCASVC